MLLAELEILCLPLTRTPFAPAQSSRDLILGATLKFSLYDVKSADVAHRTFVIHANTSINRDREHATAAQNLGPQLQGPSDHKSRRRKTFLALKKKKMGVGPGDPHPGGGREKPIPKELGRRGCCLLLSSQIHFEMMEHFQ